MTETNIKYLNIIITLYTPKYIPGYTYINVCK